MKISITTMLFLSTVALGCNKKEETTDKKQPTTETPKPTSAPKPATAPVAANVVEPEPEAEAVVPTVADFETDAIENISDETLEKELSAIERELGE